MEIGVSRSKEKLLKLIVEDADFLSELSEVEKKIVSDIRIPPTLGGEETEAKKQNILKILAIEMYNSICLSRNNLAFRTGRVV